MYGIRISQKSARSWSAATQPAKSPLFGSKHVRCGWADAVRLADDKVVKRCALHRTPRHWREKLKFIDLLWPFVRILILLTWQGTLYGQELEPSYSVLFSTGFELDEEYEAGIQLSSQNGWLSYGSGGNGVVTNFFEGYGQQGYVGFNPPAPKDNFLNLWNPIGLATVSSNEPIVRFYVLMQIADSTNGQYDDFRWSVYNTDQHRLFSLDFDNSTLEISYGLDDEMGFVPSGLSFDNDGFYDLVVTMDFAQNTWSALMNDVSLVTSQPITTTGATLNIGDIDAVWAIRKQGFPGDNYMLFDEYEIISSSRGAMQPRLEHLGFFDGVSWVRLYGEEGVNYTIEWSSNLTDWEPLFEVLGPVGGVLDLEDPDAKLFTHGFYRVRQIP